MSLYDDYRKHREGQGRSSLSSNNSLYDQYLAYKEGKTDEPVKTETKNFKADYLANVDDSGTTSNYANILKSADYASLSQYQGDTTKDYSGIKGRWESITDIFRPAQDKQYEAINGVSNDYGNGLFDAFSKAMDALGKQVGADDVPYLSMTETEKGIYNYLYNTGDTEGAAKYYKEIEPALLERAKNMQAQEEYEKASEGGYGRVLGTSIANLPKSVISGVNTAIVGGLAGISSELTGDGFQEGWTDFANRNALGSQVRAELAANAAKIAEDTSTFGQDVEGKSKIQTGIEKGLNAVFDTENLPSALYNTGMSAAENLIGLALTKGLTSTAGALGISANTAQKIGEAIYLTSMGGNAAEQKTLDILQRGGTEEEAALSGITSGLIEAATEHLGFDTAFDIITGKSITSAGAVAKSLASMFGSEALEESTSDVLNRVADYFVLDKNGQGAKSEWQEYYEARLAEGNDAKTAENLTLQAFWRNATADALFGGLSGIALGGASVGANVIENRSTGKAINRAQNVDKLREQAIEAGRNDLAGTLEKNPSKAQIGFVQNELLNDAYDRATKEGATTEDALNYLKTAQAAEANKLSKTGIADKKGNPLHIKNINWDGDNPVFETEEGFFKASDVVVSDSAAGLINLSENIDKVARKAFIENYKGGNLGDYADAFNVAYEYGKRGLTDSLQELVKEGSLTFEQARNIYAAGLMDKESITSKLTEAQKRIDQRRKMFPNRKLRAKIDDSAVDYSRITDNQRKNLHFIEAVAKAFGVNVKVFDSEKTPELKDKNGAFDDNNTIFLDINASNTGAHGDKTNAITTTMSHELTHWAKKNAPELYKAFRAEVLRTLAEEYGNLITEKTGNDIKVNIADYVKLMQNEKYKGLSEEAVEDELIARACENMLSNSQYAQKALANMTKEEQKTFGDKVAELFKKIIEAIKEIMGRYDSKSAEYQLLARDAETLEGLQRSWDNMIKAAAENVAYTVDENPDNSKEMFSEKEAEQQYHVDKNGFVVIDSAKFSMDETADYKNVKDAVRAIMNDFAGKTAVIEADSRSVIFTKRGAKEYANSSSAFVKDDRLRNAHANASVAFMGIVEKAIDPLWQKNTEDKHEVDAHRGWQKYETRFAVTINGSLKYFVGELQVGLGQDLLDRGVDVVNLHEIKEPNNYVSDYKSSRKNNRVPSWRNIKQITEEVKKKYPRYDSTDNILTYEQERHFADSKIWDKKGRLIKVYHGTPTGGFTVFRNGLTYFTANRDYAKRYTRVAGSGRNGNTPQIYEGYINIIKPFSLDDKKAKDIYINEYIKGGYAQGMNPYASDAEIEKYAANGIDWNEADNLYEFLDENGYDYDGFILNEGGDLTDQGTVSRGPSYVTFKPNQFKRADNLNPTDADDMQFSMKSPVESVGDLVAIHNMHESDLIKTLKLGGFPMPSIAVMRADNAGQNSQYGEISIVFDKDTIDPKRAGNKVYGLDIWSPTYPDIKYKLNEKKSYDLYKKIQDIKLPKIFKINPVSFNSDNLESKFNSRGGEIGVIDDYMNDVDMKNTFLAQIGNEVNEYVQNVTETTLTDEQIREAEYILKNHPELTEMTGIEFVPYAREHIDELRANMAGIARDVYKLDDEAVKIISEGMRLIDIKRIVQQARNYKANGKTTTVSKDDIQGTIDLINSRVDEQKYREWLESLFTGLVEKRGIYNGKDPYNARGDRRSWEALHFEETLENVVREMKTHANGESLFGAGALWAAGAKNYKSLDEIRKDKNRLKVIPEEEYSKIKEEYGSRMSDLAGRLMAHRGSTGNPFIDKDNAMSAILELFMDNNGNADIVEKKLNGEYGYKGNIHDIVTETKQLLIDVGNMPTGYFEAKPERPVTFSEVYRAVVPDNVSQELKDLLAESNVPVDYYEAGNDEARLADLNELTDVRFSEKSDDERIFYTHGTEVIQNPTDTEYMQMREEILNDYPWLRGTGEILLRHTYDEDGNVYYWDASKGMHRQIEPEINKRYNTRTSQHWEWWKQPDKDDYLLAYSWKDDEGNLHLDFDTEEFEQYAKVERDVKRLSKEWRDKYGVQESAAEISRMLKAVIESDKAGYEKAVDELTRTLVKNARSVEPGIKAEADRVKKELKKYKFSMNDKQKAEMKSAYGANWSQKIFGKLSYRKDGIPLDDLWSTLVSEYPTFFHEETDANEPVALIEAIDELYSGKYAGVEWGSEDKKEIAKEIKADIKAVYDVARSLYDDAQAPVDMETLEKKYSEAIRELHQRIAAAKREVREDAQRQRLIAKIVERENKLATMFRKNDKENHIPDILKEPLKQIFESVNIESRVSPGTMANNFTALAKALEDVTTQPEALEGLEMYFDSEGYFIQNVKDIAAELQAKIGDIANNARKGVSINDLSAESLKKLNEALAAITAAARKYDRVLAEDTNQRISDRANSSMKFVDSIAPRKATNKLVKQVVTFLGWDNVTPVYGYDRFGEGGKQTFKGIMAGDDQLTRNSKTIIDFAKNTFTGQEAEDWSNEIQSVTVAGKEYFMTTAQIMSLYCLNKRESAKQHLYLHENVYGEEIQGQGIIIGENKETEKTGVIHVTENDIKAITDLLTDRQKEVADKLQEFLSTVCSDWGNYVTMRRFGIMQFGEKNYFPMNVNPNNRASLPQETMQQASIFKLLNMGFTKSLNERGNGALIISSIFDVFTKHASEMAAYNAMALPILDAYKWLSYKVRNGQDIISFKDQIEKTYGSDGLNFILDHLADLNGTSKRATSAEQFVKSVIRRYKTAATAANLRVVLMQPTSYLRALNEIDGKYLRRAITINPKELKATIAEMNEKSALAMKKNGLGAFDLNVSRTIEEQAMQSENVKGVKGAIQKAMDASMWLAGKADEITWGTLYKAVQLEISEKTDLKGEAFDKAVNDRFEDICYRTQVFDDINARSNLMRKKDIAHQVLTAFGSESTLSYSMLSNNVFMYAVEARNNRAAAWHKYAPKIKRAFVSYLMSAIAVSAVAAVPDWLRDDDDEEGFIQKYFKNLGMNILGEATGLLPYIRDIASIFQGYDPSRPDEEIIKTARQFVNHVLKSDGKISYRTVYSAAKLFSQATGVPVANVVRDIKSLWNKTIGEIFGMKIE